MGTPPIPNTRLAMMAFAILSSLLASVSYAAVVGKTKIHSIQHEPLVASIEVSDIDPDQFSATVAPASIYKQMGLSNQVPVEVKFVKTSETTGKLVLSSSKPVSDPFTDVVLTLRDKGKQQAVPKTLLLPINKINPKAKLENIMIGSTARPNLPQISSNELSNRSAKALTIKKSAPPILANSSLTNRRPNTTVNTERSINANGSTPSVAANNTANISITAPVLVQKPRVATTTPPMFSKLLPDVRQSMPALPTAASTMFEKVDAIASTSKADQSDRTVLSSTSANNMPNASKTTTPVPSTPLATTSAPVTPLPTSALSSMDSQLDLLSTNITRNYQPSDNPSAVDTIPPPMTNLINDLINDLADDKVSNKTSSSENAVDTTQPLTDFPLEAVDKRQSMLNKTTDSISEDSSLLKGDIPTENALDTQNAYRFTNKALNATAESSDDSQRTNFDSAALKKELQAEASVPTYTVQKNDNLWTISQQIAAKNNLSVDQVMQQIQSYNPDAFIEGKQSLLLADAQLQLPGYEVVPSKLGVKAAREARKKYTHINKKSKSKATSSINAKKPTRKPVKNRKQPSTTQQMAQAKRELSKPRLTLVTPNAQGKATGTASTGTTQNPEVSKAVMANLNLARQQTAKQAQRVKNVNSLLAEHTLKLKLNNQKLATLQKRLKQLREQ